MTLRRREPYVGMPVTVASLAAQRAGTVVELSADRRRLVVVTDDGARLAFALSRATARFMEEGDQTGARLLFEPGG